MHTHTTHIGQVDRHRSHGRALGPRRLHHGVAVEVVLSDAVAVHLYDTRGTAQQVRWPQARTGLANSLSRAAPSHCAPCASEQQLITGACRFGSRGYLPCLWSGRKHSAVALSPPPSAHQQHLLRRARCAACPTPRHVCRYGTFTIALLSGALFTPSPPLSSPAASAWLRSAACPSPATCSACRRTRP